LGAAGLAALGAAGLGLASCGSSPALPKPDTTVGMYLSAWQAHNWGAMAGLLQPPATNFRGILESVDSDLGVRQATYTAGTVVTTEKGKNKGQFASVPVTSDLVLSGGIKLSLHSELHLLLVDRLWQIRWSPTTVASQLVVGTHFVRSSSWPPRASILGAGGANLTSAEITVGLAGYRITNPAQVQQVLVAAGLDPTLVARGLAAAEANPKLFEPIETIPAAQYAQIKAQIYPVPGTQFETAGAQGALTPNLGQFIVGTVGPITAQQLTQFGPQYHPGDNVGQSGLELAFQPRLAGRPDTSIDIVNSKAKAVARILHIPAKPGAALVTGLNPTVQQAAEAALAGITQPAALVAIDATTGQILASVTEPTTQFSNLAFVGQYPPGSTFKVVTSTALLEAGLTPATEATCPVTIDVDGKTFHNYENETQSTLSFEQAFAESCNTAFIGMATSKLQDSSLASAAKIYGLGARYKVGLNAFSGSVPEAASEVDLAADAIGQGQLVVSPLAMASLAAAVDSGTWRAPILVTGLHTPDPATRGPINPTLLSSLKAMMAQVVATGTASSAGLPAGTYGKTGTAEFGTSVPPGIDAWFIGFNGNIAFAALVANATGTGGMVVAPLVAKFINAVIAAGVK
jgi:hypothetical protein